MKKVNNFPEEISEQEQRIISSIRSDFVPAVSQDEVKTVCKVAVSCYTESQSIRGIGLWKVVFSCLTINIAFFWILSAFLLGTCVVIFFLTTRYGMEPLALMTAFSPIPILVFAIRELQYRDDSFVQLEKTCKYAPAKLYFIRLWLGMIFNAVFFGFAESIIFTSYKNLLQLYFCSFIAMFFVGAVVLLLLFFLDHALPVSFIMAAWVLGAAYLLCQDEILAAVMGTSLTVFIGVLVFSFALFAGAAIKSTTKRYA